MPQVVTRLTDHASSSRNGKTEIKAKLEIKITIRLILGPNDFHCESELSNKFSTKIKVKVSYFNPTCVRDVKDGF